MHFCIYAILENEKLENFDRQKFEDDFTKKFCDCCGETEPEIQDVADWWEIGGRWVDCLNANFGLHGQPAWMMHDHEEKDGHYSICEIKDLVDTGEHFEPYAFVLHDEYFEKDAPEYQEILAKVRNKTLNGVIVSLDCHM